MDRNYEAPKPKEPLMRCPRCHAEQQFSEFVSVCPACGTDSRSATAAPRLGDHVTGDKARQSNGNWLNFVVAGPLLAAGGALLLASIVIGRNGGALLGIPAAFLLGLGAFAALARSPAARLVSTILGLGGLACLAYAYSLLDGVF